MNCAKHEFSHQGFLWLNVTKSLGIADLVTFIKETLNEKLYSLCIASFSGTTEKWQFSISGLVILRMIFPRKR